MAIQWEEIEDEAIALLASNEFEPQEKMYKYLLKWGNRTITEIAQEMDIRQHLQTCTITFTNSDLSKTLPAVFLKHSHRFTRVRADANGDDNYIEIIGLDELYAKDPDHDETTDSNPDYVSVEGHRIYVHPMFAGDLTLENYFRRPTPMTERNSYPDLPNDDETVLYDMILAGVLRKGFLWLQDFDMAKYYIETEFPRLRDLYNTNLDKTNSQIKHKHTYF